MVWWHWWIKQLQTLTHGCGWLTLKPLVESERWGAVVWVEVLPRKNLHLKGRESFLLRPLTRPESTITGRQPWVVGTWEQRFVATRLSEFWNLGAKFREPGLDSASGFGQISLYIKFELRDLRQEMISFSETYLHHSRKWVARWLEPVPADTGPESSTWTSGSTTSLTIGPLWSCQWPNQYVTWAQGENTTLHTETPRGRKFEPRTFLLLDNSGPRCATQASGLSVTFLIIKRAQVLLTVMVSKCLIRSESCCPRYETGH